MRIGYFFSCPKKRLTPECGKNSRSIARASLTLEKGRKKTGPKKRGEFPVGKGKPFGVSCDGKRRWRDLDRKKGCVLFSSDQQGVSEAPKKKKGAFAVTGEKGGRGSSWLRGPPKPPPRRSPCCFVKER